MSILVVSVIRGSFLLSSLVTLLCNMRVHPCSLYQQSGLVLWVVVHRIFPDASRHEVLDGCLAMQRKHQKMPPPHPLGMLADFSMFGHPLRASIHCDQLRLCTLDHDQLMTSGTPLWVLQINCIMAYLLEVSLSERCTNLAYVFLSAARSFQLRVRAEDRTRTVKFFHLFSTI